MATPAENGASKLKNDLRIDVGRFCWHWQNQAISRNVTKNAAKTSLKTTATPASTPESSHPARAALNERYVRPSSQAEQKIGKVTMSSGCVSCQSVAAL
jgi:hypothetical protein